MPVASKRLIALIFLLVLASLAAHVLADIQPAANSVQADLATCFLHIAILLPTLGAVVFVPATVPIIVQQARQRASLGPIPFHPPAF